VKDPSSTQSSAHSKLKSYLRSNGYSQSDGDKYISKIYYSSDYSTKYTVYIRLDTATDKLYIDMLSEGSSVDIFYMVELSESTTSTTTLLYDPNGYGLYATGYVYKSSFSSSNYTTIYSFTTDAPSSAQSDMKGLLGSGTMIALLHADSMLSYYGVGVTMADLGFTKI
jgi:hypothetical protein